MLFRSGIRPNVELDMEQDVERQGPKYDWLLNFQVSTISFNIILHGHYLYHCVVFIKCFSFINVDPKIWRPDERGTDHT